MAHPKNSLHPHHKSINCRGKLIDLRKPAIMGILNLTEDSFYDGGRYNTPENALEQAKKLLEEGADIIDIGAQSTRPGAELLSDENELKKLIPLLDLLIREIPEIVISIDTFHSRVAKECLDRGASIINDVSAGDFDGNMIDTVASYDAPYVAMQKNPTYQDVTEEVFEYLLDKVYRCRNAGITDVIIDPGFGFGKTRKHNYRLLADLASLHKIEAPLLVGVSRKSMVWGSLSVSPEEALNGTTVVNTLALDRGADILRVHDVKEAKEAIELVQLLHNS